MSGSKPRRPSLRQRLEDAEATLAALCRGEVDLVVGSEGPLVVRLKSLSDELERLPREWQATFDATADAIFVLDTEQRVVRANRAAEIAFDCPRTDMIGKYCCEIVHGQAVPIPECPFHRMRESLRRETLEVQLGERWFVITADPLLDEAGRFAGAVHIARDITERKRAEKVLRESEIRYRELVENTASCVAVYLPVEDGQDFVFVAFNQAAERAERTPREAVLGRRVTEVFPGVAEMGLLDVFRRVSRSGEPERWPCSYYADEHHAGWRENFVYRLPSGEIVAIYEDVTERKRAEQAVRESESFLRATLDALSSHIAVLDASGRIVLTNRAWREFAAANGGDPSALAEGADYLAVCDAARGEWSAEAAIFGDAIRKVLAGSLPFFEIEYPCHGPQEKRWFIARVTPFSGPGPQRAVVSHENITARRQAEEALRESEERFRRLAENAQDLIYRYELTPQRRFSYVSPAATAMTGYTPEEHYADPDLGRKLVHPDDRPLLEQYLRGEGIFRAPLTLRWVRKDGSILWAEQRNVPVFDETGALVAIEGIARDVSERRRAEERIRQSEETYRNLFHNAQVGLFRTRIADGKILESNLALARMFGYDSREAFIAEYATGGNYVDPGTRERMLEMLRRDGFVESFEARFYRRDHSIFWARYSARIYPEHGWIEGVAEDITAHKLAEEALRASEERFRRAVAEAPYPAAIYAEDGEAVFINAEWTRLTGWRQEDIPTVEAWLEKAYEEGREEVRHTIGAVFAASEPTTTQDTVIRCRDGTTRTWSFRSTPLGRDERGRRLVLSMAVDVSERQQLEAQLRHAQKMEAIGRLAGGVAHDFNNLLQAMLAAVQSLRLRYPDPATLPATAELEKYVQRGADLTRQLLLFSRRARPHPEPLDLNEAVRRAADMLRRLLPENIEVVTALAAGQLFAEVDPAQLEQVLMNLAVNARDAMPEGGRLSLSTGSANGEAFIDVADTGVGMPASVRERIFEPFFTTKVNGRGTGIGLSVVHGIVTEHGGRIEVESEPGKGSRFRVLLPLRPAPTPGLPSEEGAGLPAEGRGERVLVVEDEEGARKGLAEILELLGYQPTAVASAEEALALPEDPPFHALLSDLMLPGMAGGRLATVLLARWPQLAVVLMSGYPGDDRVRFDVPEGVRVLQKPFDIEELGQELRAVLDARRR